MYFEDKKLAKKDVDLPGFGFLSAQPGSSKRRPCVCYGFTHKSFQEFFAAHYLCCQLVSKETSPEILVTDTRYFRELREVLKFTCGLLTVRIGTYIWHMSGTSTGSESSTARYR
ncbi:unnamed protein product [Porites evermanni]|uniref:Uncharacterized protein n=1 Tax=Porites evermanni TaxID=104178 RepID=A0ABN8PW13_9CNID|nr:unnamed protein product [Porites evermanni]